MTKLCDECGMTAIGSIFLETGRVLKDGKELGQSVHLCKKHWIIPGLLQQPKNCQHIYFQWPASPISLKNSLRTVA